MAYLLYSFLRSWRLIRMPGTTGESVILLNRARERPNSASIPIMELSMLQKIWIKMPLI